MDSIKIVDPDPRMNQEICDLLIRSISELCEKDHHNDADFIKKWLANKTPENVRSWIERNKTYCAISKAGSVVGVLQVDSNNEILLNYVDPKMIGLGIGAKMLEKLEMDLGEGSIVMVKSTETARPFYEHNGFKITSEKSNAMFKQISL